jgi:hypothetical protein
MLVCNVSLRPPRVAIAASINETGAAVDATATGNIVFATLIDDPASVADFVDAYSGEIMREAATAADVVDAGSLYIAAIDESVTAVHAQDAPLPMTYAGAIIEAATATSSQDAAFPVVVNLAPVLGSRAGRGAATIAEDGSGKTRII